MRLVPALILILLLGACSAEPASFELATKSDKRPSRPTAGSAQQATNAQNAASTSEPTTEGSNPVSAFFWALDAAVQKLIAGASTPATPGLATGAASEGAPAAARNARADARRVATTHLPKAPVAPPEEPVRSKGRAAISPGDAPGQRASAPREKASPRQESPAPQEGTSSTRFANPAITYEEAMLRRDVRTMARAVRQITGEPVTPASIRALNEQIGIDADEELIEAIARAAR